MNNNVSSFFEDYKESLKLERFSISKSRQDEKIEKMRTFLKSLDMLSFNRHCNNKSLGQIFIDSNETKRKFDNLYRANFSDESKTQWACSYFSGKFSNTTYVVIHRILVSWRVIDSTIEII